MNRWSGGNTLRGQIFLGFMIVIVIVLSAVGFFVYNEVSNLLRNNAERHIQQTATQAMGKLEVLLQQVDTFTTQVATNAVVQGMLAKEVAGQPISFEERQQLLEEVRSLEAYTTGVRAVEIYTSDYRRLMPLTDVNLLSRLSVNWVQQANEGMGKNVWLGLDPRYPNVVLAIRQVRLIDHSYSYAGYVLVHIEQSYFQLADTDSTTRERMGLINEHGQIISADYPETIEIDRLLTGQESIDVDGEDYIAVRERSPDTGWHIVILTPAAYTMEGLSVLRTVVMVSVAVGSVLFLLVTYVLSGMITRPILDLIKAMRNVRFGSLKPIQIRSSTMEINELNYTYNEMVRTLNELNEKVYQKEIVQSRTELKALQAQINPHFLFNTLEALYWSLEDKEEEELANIVLAMSGLFRYVISREAEDEWVTIGDELDHVERYLKIMKMRMVDRLRWCISANDRVRNIRIPKLLVQPLVENAILHGIEQRLDPGTVKVSVMPDDQPGRTRIEVFDDGPGIDSVTLEKLRMAMNQGTMQSAKGTGLGLVNVERRLQLYFKGNTDGLSIKSEQGHGTTVSFVLPDVSGGGDLT